MTGDIIATRTVFERWMQCFPNEQAWLTYIKFEQRCGKFDNARNLYERMLEQIPEESVILSELVHGVVLHQVRKVGGAPGQPRELPGDLRAIVDGAVPGEYRRRTVTSRMQG